VTDFRDPGSFPRFRTSAAQLNICSTVETLDRLRQIFRLSVSDLAAACQVSRQTVYKWIGGEPSRVENRNRLDDLYGAAELFASRGIMGSAILLKRGAKEARI
jgi:transcriptional regulator with XRE-family HTH domain